MCVTVEQAARLLDVPRGEAEQALSALEAEGLLLRWANTYRRASPLQSLHDKHRSLPGNARDSRARWRD